MAEASPGYFWFQSTFLSHLVPRGASELSEGLGSCACRQSPGAIMVSARGPGLTLPAQLG